MIIKPQGLRNPSNHHQQVTVLSLFIRTVVVSRPGEWCLGKSNGRIKVTQNTNRNDSHGAFKVFYEKLEKVKFGQKCVRNRKVFRNPIQKKTGKKKKKTVIVPRSEAEYQSLKAEIQSLLK